VVALLAIALHANTLDGALMYDDTNAVVRNALVRAGDLGAIFTEASWWREGHGRGWRPVTTTSFALNHMAHGFAPRGYHAVNLLLHAGVSVLVLLTLAAATGRALVALVAALLFALHPVHTEAVASVVGRSELLAAAGFFLAWWCFLRRDAGGVRLWDAAGVAAFAAGLLAKENAVTLLPVLVLADAVYPGAGAAPAAALRRHAGRYAALAAATAAFVVVRRLVIGPDAPSIPVLDNPLVALPAWPRALTTIAVVGLYAWRLLVPVRLAADYSYDQIPAVASPLDPGFLAGLAVLLAVPALAWWCRARLPAATLGLVLLALTFGLVSNLAFPIGTIMAERLLYLPSVGFCLALAAALVAAAGARPAPAAGAAASSPLRALVARPALVLAVAALLLAYGARTWTRNRVWHDPEVFYATMVAEAPRSARSQREYGGMLAERGRHAEARRAFERSLAIRPADVATLHNLGNALVQAGDLDAAADAYARAIAGKPDFTDSIVNLATVEGRRGNVEAAIAWLRKALAHQPRAAAIHMNLANTLFQAGRTAEAGAEYEAARALAPDSPDIATNYGVFLYAHGQYDAAAAMHGRAAAVDLRAALGEVASYHAAGKPAAARAALARAERRFPGAPALAELRRQLEARS